MSTQETAFVATIEPARGVPETTRAFLTRDEAEAFTADAEDSDIRERSIYRIGTMAGNYDLDATPAEIIAAYNASQERREQNARADAQAHAEALARESARREGR